jgi:hydrogenase assembly chaperone HypC/HupF
VIEIEGDGELRMPRVDFSGVQRQACLAYVPEARIGDYVLVHVGFAISTIDEEAALAAVRSQPGGEGARIIGRVLGEDPGRLVLRTRIGSHRLLERLSGEQLPRIC